MTFKKMTKKDHPDLFYVSDTLKDYQHVRRTVKMCQETLDIKMENVGGTAKQAKDYDYIAGILDKNNATLMTFLIIGTGVYRVISKEESAINEWGFCYATASET